MIGIFESIEKCILHLQLNGFSYYFVEEGHEVYINRTSKEVAKIYTYKDNSASPLYG